MQKFFKNFKCIHLAPTCIDPIRQKCKFFLSKFISRRPPCCIYKNVNSFQTDAVILTTFQQLTSYSKQYGSLGLEMQIFKIKDGSDCWAEFNRCRLAQEVCWGRQSNESHRQKNPNSIVATIPYCNYSKRLSEVDRGTSGHRCVTKTANMNLKN